MQWVILKSNYYSPLCIILQIGKWLLIAAIITAVIGNHMTCFKEIICKSTQQFVTADAGAMVTAHYSY